MLISQEEIERFNTNPLYQTTGIQALSAGDGKAVSELKPPENVCWPFPGQPHGGIIFTQMDTTMAWAVVSAAGEGTNCATVNMEIQYPLPAKGPVFTCEAQVLHRTGRSCFVRGETRDEGANLVAMAQATFHNLVYLDDLQVPAHGPYNAEYLRPSHMLFHIVLFYPSQEPSSRSSPDRL